MHKDEELTYTQATQTGNADIGDNWTYGNIIYLSLLHVAFRFTIVNCRLPTWTVFKNASIRIPETFVLLGLNVDCGLL